MDKPIFYSKINKINIVDKGTANIKDVFYVIKDFYRIEVDSNVNVEYAVLLIESLKSIPRELVIDCNIKKLSFKDYGPSKDFYPNHGKYINDTLFLNTNLLKDKRFIYDTHTGNGFTKFEEILYHELGHGYDNHIGGRLDLSAREEWLELSKWSEEPKIGYKRVRIKEEGSPEVVGEYYYAPDAEFIRFYSRRNPWDDWADCFSYYIGGLHGLIPKSKKLYFDKLLKKYF